MNPPQHQTSNPTHAVVLSPDLLPYILAADIPPKSTRHQAWLASLALVHRTWRTSVTRAIRQHPIITSMSKMLHFQDSLWAVDHRTLSPGSMLTRRSCDYPHEVRVPLASLIHSLILDFRPSGANAYPCRAQGVPHRPHGQTWTPEARELKTLQMSKELYLDPTFFKSLRTLESLHLSHIKLSISSFEFLVETVSPTLKVIGLHDVQFLNSSSISSVAATSLVFDSILLLPELTTLHLSGALAGVEGIWSVLSPAVHRKGLDESSGSLASNHHSRLNTRSVANQPEVDHGVKRSKLNTLILSESRLSNSNQISPIELISRWHLRSPSPVYRAEDCVR